MTGKHRDFRFKSKHVYSVGTRLKLEKILKEDKDNYKHLVYVNAKKGNVGDVYILYSDKPEEVLGNLVEIEKVEQGFMYNTYYVRSLEDMVKIKRVSH